MTSTRIIDFWRSNRKLWISVTHEDKLAADETITKLFSEYDYTNETFSGQVIYLDQFMRHFDRTADLTEPRKKACSIVRSNLDVLMRTDDEIELVFCLMPFKHLGEYEFVFETIHTWLAGIAASLTDFPQLSKFYNDTYRKAYTFEAVKAAIKTEHDGAAASYDPVLICDSYPSEYASDAWTLSAAGASPLRDLLATAPDIISLSGGVDSMVMAALLTGRPGVVAVHIIYGNREESEQEYAFIAKYCHRLGIPFYTFTIPWLRRSIVDREFYESMTRDLRFMVYRAVGESCGKPTAPLVALGHIQDDVVENIWSNLAKGQHLSNLKKMSRMELHDGVTIFRPFLTVEKDEIYRVSKELHIPYLKNTTPAWSNRGKFRNEFHAATHKQFGESVDRKLLEVADAYEEQSRIVSELLYAPILKSGVETGVYDVTTAISVKMSVIGWSYILEAMCHAKGLPRPGIHALKAFVSQLYFFKRDYMSMSLKKDVTVVVYRDGERWMCKIH